ncbi:hypothetical protein [Nocardia transvalensis]|uniref:hypothetical protein n=1 Tax=Nocardia transvalensis TaxID=37333 RepID=UPI0018962B3B|nr:hypothetical protein [Nocardia transvalensis]MBF6331859.1 hypothetical protein [Nocardia transvalensis]
MTGHADRDPTRSVPDAMAEAAAYSQCQLYREVYRIPAEVVPDADGIAWVQMPVCASYSAVSVPTGLARHALGHLHVAAIEDRLAQQTTILVFPDTLTPRQRGALDRLGITVAAYGSRIRLPIGGNDYPLWWARTPTAPAYFVRLSEIAATAASFENGPRP